MRAHAVGIIPSVFDAVPVAQMIQPELFSGSQYRIDYRNGRLALSRLTVAQPCDALQPERCVTVLEHGDGVRFSALMLDALKYWIKHSPTKRLSNEEAQHGGFCLRDSKRTIADSARAFRRIFKRG
jgi:hypothetical protein